MEVKNSMPTEHGDTTVNNLEMNVGSSSVTYKFKVRYYNEAECPAKIGDVYYNTISEACAVGGDVVLVRSSTEDVVIPAGITVRLNLNGNSITSNKSHAITNNGSLVLIGNGVVDCVTPKMVALQNNDGAECVVNTGVEICRSTDTAESTTAETGYTVRNYGKMTINDGAYIHAANKVSTLVVNGYYDTSKAGPDDKAEMTINGGDFVGGKFNVKNDELGVMSIFGGNFTGGTTNNSDPETTTGDAPEYAIQNWHILTIEDGEYAGRIANGTYGKGIGKLTIRNGNFVNAELCLIASYQSEDITIFGGVFSNDFADINKYLAEGYMATQTNDGMIVSKMSVYQQVDNVINGLDEKGLDIVEDPDNARQYNVTVGAANFDAVIDEIVAVDGIKKLTVGIDGTDTSYEYVPGTDDISAFKANVNSLMPASNTDSEVTLVMTVE